MLSGLCTVQTRGDGFPWVLRGRQGLTRGMRGVVRRHLPLLSESLISLQTPPWGCPPKTPTTAAPRVRFQRPSASVRHEATCEHGALRTWGAPGAPANHSDWPRGRRSWGEGSQAWRSGSQRRRFGKRRVCFALGSVTLTHVGAYGTRPASDGRPAQGRTLDQGGNVRTDNSDDKALAGCPELGESRNPRTHEAERQGRASDAPGEPGCTPLSPCFQNGSQDDGRRAMVQATPGGGAPRGRVSAAAGAAGPGQRLSTAEPRPVSAALTGGVGGGKSPAAAAPETGPAERGPHCSPRGAPGSGRSSQRRPLSRDPPPSLPALCSETLLLLCMLQSSGLAAL